MFLLTLYVRVQTANFVVHWHGLGNLYVNIFKWLKLKWSKVPTPYIHLTLNRYPYLYILKIIRILFRNIEQIWLHSWPCGLSASHAAVYCAKLCDPQVICDLRCSECRCSLYVCKVPCYTHVYSYKLSKKRNYTIELFSNKKYVYLQIDIMDAAR